MKQLAIFLLFILFLSCHKEMTPGASNENLGQISFTTDTITIFEADTILFIPVQLTLKGDKPIYVHFHVEGNSATNGYDYFVSDGFLEFPKGEDTTESIIVVNIYPDTITEPDETLTIFLDSASNAIISTNQLTLKILGDESHRITYPGYSTPLSYIGYTLIWQDEFLGNELNENSWNYRQKNGCPSICGFGNNELQYYQKENAVVANDLLTITAKKETIGTNGYTSARINTKSKVSVPYGRIDIRAQLPFGKGIWPAIWLMGNNKDEVGWPTCGEIDIMELRGSKPKTINGTLHYKNASGVHQNPISKSKTLIWKDYSDEFHVFSIIRNDSSISWYMDDILFNTKLYSNLNLGTQSNPFLQDFFILINVAVGGNYDGNPSNNTSFPQDMKIDYVRVFSKD